MHRAVRAALRPKTGARNRPPHTRSRRPFFETRPLLTGSSPPAPGVVAAMFCTETDSTLKQTGPEPIWCKRSRFWTPFGRNWLLYGALRGTHFWPKTPFRDPSFGGAAGSVGLAARPGPRFDARQAMGSARGSIGQPVVRHRGPRAQLSGQKRGPETDPPPPDRADRFLKHDPS